MYQFHVPQLTLAIVLLTQGTANSREHAENLLMQLYDFVVSTHNTFFQIDVGKRREAVEKAMKIGIL